MTSNANINKINGLVLAGGKSSRLGQDKSLLQWHGVAQFQYAISLLQPFCNRVFVSCKREHANKFGANTALLFDDPTLEGPSAGILSAFSFEPSASWLVLACDLPLVTAATLAQLLDRRDANCIATTFASPHDGLPEPLIAIWEPRSKELLQQQTAAGFRCPRKVMINNHTKVIEPLYPEQLLNVNTVNEAEIASKTLAN